MKKVLAIATFAFGLSFASNAQSISPNAIGIRAGAGNGLGTEISYQRAMGSNNRLEIDLGLNSNDNLTVIGINGVYQWVWNLDGGLNWYAGAGAAVATWDYDDDFPGSPEGGLNIGATGQLGLEYNFDFPLLLSLDWRPNFWVLDDAGFDWNGIALGIRYQF